MIDTLRADAVSMLGAPPDVTPNLQRLADEGLLYTRAQAPAPWTLPSHASLFTGLNPAAHRVGLGGRVTLGEEFVTLAERLRDVGYQTVGFAENPLVSPPFRLAQGFDQFTAQTVEEVLSPSGSRFDVVSGVARWADGSSSSSPFFLFVNLFDAHEPYSVREVNPHLPEGVGAREARAIEQSTHRICDAIPSPRELAILRGLYLGDVAAADAKLGEIIGTLRREFPRRRMVTVVTSDHGEHLGEHRLLDHQFSLSDVLLHVPLMVSGLEGVAPARIEQPVEISDVFGSVLSWAGVAEGSDPAPRTLPVVSGTSDGRPLFSVYSDSEDSPPTDWPADVHIPRPPGRPSERSHCDDSDRVFGDLAAVVRFPYKLLWYERYPAALHDLRWDEMERSDLSRTQPDRARQLEQELLAFRAAHRLDEASAPAEVDPEAREALRALGYLE